MRRFFSPDLGEDGAVVVLDATVSHHLLRVSGIGRGDQVALFDGQGRGRRARLVEVTGGRAVLEPEGEVYREEGAAESWLLVGLSRARVFDVVLRMATELGVGHIWPIQAERSVVRGERLARWQRITQAALGQCGGLTLPELTLPMPLGDALDRLPPEVERRLFRPGVARRPPVWGPVALLIGPEGGWSPAEIELAGRRQCVSCGLGPRTLRVDTAVAAALGALRPATPA